MYLNAISLENYLIWKLLLIKLMMELRQSIFRRYMNTIRLRLNKQHQRSRFLSMNMNDLFIQICDYKKTLRENDWALFRNLMLFMKKMLSKYLRLNCSINKIAKIWLIKWLIRMKLLMGNRSLVLKDFRLSMKLFKNNLSHIKKLIMNLWKWNRLQI